jgi:Proteasome stabiliser
LKLCRHAGHKQGIAQHCATCSQVIFACVYGADTTLRLKQAGMEYAVWVFKHAADAQLAPMAPVVLQGLLRLLDAGASSQLQRSQSC